MFGASLLTHSILEAQCLRAPSLHLLLLSHTILSHPGSGIATPLQRRAQMTSACVLRRLHAQLQAAEAHAQDVERTVQGQLVAALDKLAVLNVDPPQAIVRSLADVHAFAESVKERCQRLEEQSAAAHRCTAAPEQSRHSSAAIHNGKRTDSLSVWEYHVFQGPLGWALVKSACWSHSFCQSPYY